MEEHHLAGPEHKLERLIFFSDAVFAIAITLLVIEIHAPHLPFAATAQDYALALLHELPSFGGFVISFFVIGAFWAAHHRTFALARHWSDRLVAPNLMLLAAIAAMPFFTAFMSGNGGMLVPSVVYAATLIVTGLLSLRLTRLATSPGIVCDDVAPLAIAVARSRGLGVILGAILSLGVAFVDARFSQVTLLAIPLLQLLVRRVVRGRAGVYQDRGDATTGHATSIRHAA